MSEEIILTLFYIVLSVCIVYPPQEFVSAGLTLPQIFYKYVGYEVDSFVKYHIRRINLTLLVYSLLPLGYIICLHLSGFTEQFVLSHYGLFWKVFITVSLAFPIAVWLTLKNWCDKDYENHPVAVWLSKFSNNNTDWKSVTADIDREFRRIDKVVIICNPITKLVATENWIIKVSPLLLCVTHQTDASLVVKGANTYYMSPDELSEIQFINIEIKSSRRGVETFEVRINSKDFKDLEDRLARRITVLPSVKFHKSVTERFVDVFKETVAENPKYDTNEEFEQCIGCLQAVPNIKIQKLCEDIQGGQNNCTTCYCRPMWCVECMAKWFASRQDPQQKETWLKSKCSCPMCRATFCLLDICYLNSGNTQDVNHP